MQCLSVQNLFHIVVLGTDFYGSGLDAFFVLATQVPLHSQNVRDRKIVKACQWHFLRFIGSSLSFLKSFVPPALLS